MKFLADMGISIRTAEWLREKGHDVVHLRDQGLQRISDEEITKKARLEKRIILTFDLDFGAILAVSGDFGPSVIVFRITSAKSDNVNLRLQMVLLQSCEALEKGAIISVEDDKFRIRVLPIHS